MNGIKLEATRPSSDESPAAIESTRSNSRISILVPCYNEEATIAKVIEDFRAQLPEAAIFVFDNRCTDRTAEIAREHGATVIPEPRQGKGFVVDAMFDRAEGDFFVMVDGDDTYPADRVHDLLAPVMAGEADMVNGARLEEFRTESFRPLHLFGNNLVRFLINRIFATDLKDILTGYRAFNRRVVARIPVVSAGFEVETELTIQLLYYNLRIEEVVVPYGVRPEGSVSKLNTFRDGFRVLWKILTLFRATKPLTFFGSLGLIGILLGVLAGIGPIEDYIQHRYVYRVPSAILATGLTLLGSLTIFAGLILHAINWRFKEMHNVLVRSHLSALRETRRTANPLAPAAGQALPRPRPT